MRVRFIGRRGGRVPGRVLRRIEETEALTARNRRLTLTFAFNYGGRAELVDAVRAIAREAAAGRLDPDEDRRADDRPAPLRARHARSRPARAHVGRVPDLELPAVGARVLRARLHRRALARLPHASTSSTRSPSSSAATAASAPSDRRTVRSDARWSATPRQFGTVRSNYTRVMPGLYRDEGVVLRTIKLGEADRIVTILTQGHGKVRAVAKGVRKTTSRFGARLEPTSRVALQCYRGRELDVVTQAETLEANRVLREEYALLTHAVPMLEAVDQVAQEREPNPALYRMLTGALRTLARAAEPAGHARVLLEAALARGLPSDARRLRPLRRATRGGGRRRAGRVRSRRGRRAVPGVRARRRPAAVAPGGSSCCAGCSAAGSTACSPSRRARRRTRSSSSASARSSTTSSAACAPTALL